MKLPLVQLRTIECQPKTNFVKVTTTGGDTLTAQFAMKEIRVETSFGSVKLAADTIRRIQIAAAGRSGSIRPGMIALWSAEGNANDSVGGNHGTMLNGAIFADGKVGRAFSFSGADQCVEIPYNSSLIATNYSVEVWINPRSQVNNTENQAVIFAENHGFPILVVRRGITGVRPVFMFGTSGNATGGSPFIEAASSGEIPVGQFTHLVGTWDGTTLRLCVNGILAAQAMPAAVPLSSSCPFHIGGFGHFAPDDCNTASQFFNGLIDEVSVYNHALSTSEVQTICIGANNGEPIPLTDRR